MTKDDLIAFEKSIAESFNCGEIPYPVHFSDGNEDQLIKIFKEIRAEDWVFGSWRLHYHALLKGVPPGELEVAVRRGESMALKFPEYRVYGSAIAGGCMPIALGVALAIKRTGCDEKVWCFLGDMVGRSGIFYECQRYAEAAKLSIRFVIEDNGYSVCTNTKEAWLGAALPDVSDRIIVYNYKSRYPHAGAGKRVEF